MYIQEVAAWETAHLGRCHLGRYLLEVAAWEKAYGIGLKCMLIAEFVKAGSLKINQTENFNSLGAKGLKNGQKRVNKCFTQTLNCGTFIHFSRAFQNYSFQICSFSHIKCIGYFGFFYGLDVLLPCTYPTLCIKKDVYKNPLNYYSLKLTKFHDESVKRPPPLSPSLCRVKGNVNPSFIQISIFDSQQYPLHLSLRINIHDFF